VSLSLSLVDIRSNEELEHSGDGDYGDEGGVSGCRGGVVVVISWKRRCWWIPGRDSQAVKRLRMSILIRGERHCSCWRTFGHGHVIPSVTVVVGVVTVKVLFVGAK
jgi:hypothetical protein